MDDGDKEKTVFSIGSAWIMAIHCHAIRTMQCPAMFECLISWSKFSLVCHSLLHALVYLDDILVPARTFADQISNLQQFFQRFRQVHLKLSPKKCSLFQKEVK